MRDLINGVSWKHAIERRRLHYRAKIDRLQKAPGRAERSRHREAKFFAASERLTKSDLYMKAEKSSSDEDERDKKYFIETAKVYDSSRGFYDAGKNFSVRNITRKEKEMKGEGMASSDGHMRIDAAWS